MTDDRSLYAPEQEAAEDWAAYQDELAHRAVSIASERTAQFRRRLERAGMRADEVSGVADLRGVPVLEKDDLPALQAADPPFGGMLGVDVARLKGIYLSPGSILDPEGDEPDFFRLAPALWAAGFRAGDIVQNTFAYHLTPAGVMFEQGLRTIGCVVVPGGVGNSDTQVDLMHQVGATAYVGTPNFLLTLLEHARERDVQLWVRRALVSGGPCPPSLRQKLQDEFAVLVYQSYGTADAGTLAYECEAQNGWHVSPSVVIELVDPATGEPVAAGETGEVVVTSPNEVYPLVRFGTGDLSAFIGGECSCGRTSPRLKGFLGRVGEGVKVRGMFVHSGQLARVLAEDSAVARYQARVGTCEHQDTFTVRVELRAEASVDSDALAGALREAVGLRVEVEVVEPGTIPQDGKPIVDERQLE